MQKGYSTCKVVICDVGNVIVQNYSKAIYQDIADAFGLQYEPVFAQAQSLLPQLQMGKVSVGAFFLKLARNLGKAVPKDFNELWIRSYQGELIKSTYDLTHKLRSKYRVALLSNTIQPHVKVHRHKGHFNDYDGVFLSCEVGLCKPQLGIWKLAAKELAVKEEECIYIDDCIDYVKSAESLGMKAVHRESEEQINEFLASLL